MQKEVAGTLIGFFLLLFSDQLGKIGANVESIRQNTLQSLSMLEIAGFAVVVIGFAIAVWKLLKPKE